MTVLVRNWGGYLLDEDDAEGNWGQQLFDGSCSLHYRRPLDWHLPPRTGQHTKSDLCTSLKLWVNTFFPLFNSGIRHSVDRIIDTLIEQLLLRGRRDVNEAWISMPEWKSVSELGRVYHSKVYHGRAYHGRVYHGRVPTAGIWCI